MQLSDFEKELKSINKDLSIRPNNPPPRVLERYPDTAKIASILYCGSELCAIPNGEIYDEPNGSYGIDLRQDGRFARHRTRLEALEIVKQTLQRMENDKDYRDCFLGIGAYSEASLRSRTDETGDVTLVDEVSAEIKPITDGMLEAKNE